MNVEELIERAAEMAEEAISEMTDTTPESLGLDRRCGYQMYVNEERTCIAVPLRDDRNLQYYGGFEYVDKECRHAIGGYVFYLADDGRVADHLEQWEQANA